MNAARLYRQIEALGGTASSEREKGYVEAISDVLDILERRGFSEFGDPIEALCEAVETVLTDLGQPGSDGWTEGYAHTTDIDRLRQAIDMVRGAA